jgi:outer membrane protein assembly factor BamE (lipoprotein component of BamABCDE complex)
MADSDAGGGGPAAARDLPAARIDRAPWQWHAAHMERPSPMVNASHAPARPPAPRRPAQRMHGARAGFVAAAMLLGGCGLTSELPPLPGADLFDSPRTLRGHLIDDEELRQLVVGVSSRRDVEALLGSPSATATFDDSEWFYIGGVTRQRPGRLLAIEDQQVLIVAFDNRGTVRELRRLGPQDGRDVQVVARTTPSPGNERTLLQQLFGNIGRVGPGIGAGQTGGPGAPAPTGPR